jgi:putative membrane protein
MQVELQGCTFATKENTMNRNTFRALPLVAALALASGWTFAQTGATPGGASTQSAARTASNKLDHADKEFIEDAAKGGMAEVETGKLVAQKASDPSVKEFGNRMVQDHGKANDELTQLAQSKGVKMPDKEKWGDRHEMSKLQKLSGADFDREYAQHAVKDHEKDVKKFQKAAQSAKDPDVKAFAAKTLPVLQEHLAMAQKLAGAGNNKRSSS